MSGSVGNNNWDFACSTVDSWLRLVSENRHGLVLFELPDFDRVLTCPCLFGVAQVESRLKGDCDCDTADRGSRRAVLP
ncbi:hypothetical protein PVK06_008648 [Gossypium arboreum]|uniref:Uncharacterized protein n=1 Tax=Gossypium arboreum TaxID=29729 RepID=A0ABR0QLG3_GOSAR|nr:hypothetical protein PVK06_008648 [Gossypium arboreum]